MCTLQVTVIGCGPCSSPWSMQQHLTLLSFLTIYIYLLLSFVWYFLCFSASNGNYPFFLGVYIHLLCMWISQHLVNMNWCWCFKIRYSNFLCSRVDLCHRATDHEEEGEDDEQIHIASSNSFSSIKELLPLHMVHTHVTAHSRVILANSDSAKLDNKLSQQTDN